MTGRRPAGGGEAGGGGSDVNDAAAVATPTARRQCIRAGDLLWGCCWRLVCGGDPNRCLLLHPPVAAHMQGLLEGYT